MERLEVDFFGTAQADINRIAAFVIQATDDRFGEGWAVTTNIEANHNGSFANRAGKGPPQSISDVLVEFVWHAATNVVRLKALHERRPGKKESIIEIGRAHV